MKIAFERKIKAKTKELYEKTKDLTASVKNPKSQSIIRECWGKMFGDDGQWQKAYAEFFVAFTTYQEAGQIPNAKRCLAYVVVANMLSGTLNTLYKCISIHACVCVCVHVCVCLCTCVCVCVCVLMYIHMLLPAGGEQNPFDAHIHTHTQTHTTHTRIHKRKYIHTHTHTHTHTHIRTYASHCLKVVSRTPSMRGKLLCSRRMKVCSPSLRCGKHMRSGM
jgi:hypothetical protein